jgi:hypothetical protein
MYFDISIIALLEPNMFSRQFIFFSVATELRHSHALKIVDPSPYALLPSSRISTMYHHQPQGETSMSSSATPTTLVNSSVDPFSSIVDGVMPRLWQQIV